ncbi:hypothetical protein EIP91_005744 [Steccherinum ochraceum]|uniref:Uncharacterized protein n=1 Tax=Steccherinum ochraceum TaxID=92696 RepID=A0A4R0RMD0_9APHY|nr:hypothetical protein EIP91_005744 [Steccherinum ochraceum]
MDTDNDNSLGGEDAQARRVPWFRCTPSPQSEPFILARPISRQGNATDPPFYTSRVFPWNVESLERLYYGELLNTESDVTHWKNVVEKWQGAICVGSSSKIVVFPHYASRKRRAFEILLPKPPKPLKTSCFGKYVKPPPKFEVRCVAWALRGGNQRMDPVILFSANSLIFVIDANSREDLGTIRVHGGEITSLATHPTHPYWFCATSKDMTTRMYTLEHPARQVPNNPPWPPSKHHSHAGPAFGLMSSEPEGNGIGRCLAVFVGGRSGGHQAAVNSVAFHPFLPLIATCGMDHCLKIWDIMTLTENKLLREDKPLFSTDNVHKAGVRSVHWLNQDTLISYSVPAIMRTEGGTGKGFYNEPGTVVIWRWLAFDRFFPADPSLRRVSRGCASDYRGSQSFKVLAEYSLPMDCKFVDVHYDPRTHDPILLVIPPDSKKIHIVNMTHFKAREPPPFPLDQDPNAPPENELPELARRIEASEDEDEEDEEASQTQDGDQSRSAPQKSPWPQLPPPRPLLRSVPGWEVGGLERAAQQTGTTLPNVDACEVTAGGTVIVGVGKRSTLYIWRLDDKAATIPSS